MADKWLLQDGSGSWQLQDGSGYWILQQQPSAFAPPEESDSWFAGVQFCFTAVAVAANLALGISAAQAQAVTTQDQADVYAAVSRGGSGNLQPVFIDASRGKFLQPWELEQHDRTTPPVPPIFEESEWPLPAPWAPESKALDAWQFEQHDRASPPLDESPYQPPAPWPATTAPAFWDTDTWPTPPPAPMQDEGEYNPPAPWPPESKSLPVWQAEQHDLASQPLDESPYQPPAPWPATTANPFVDTDVWAPLPPTPFFENYEWPLPPAWPATTAQPFTDPGEYLSIEGPPPPPPLRVVEDEYFPPKPWGPGYILRSIFGSGSRIDQFQVGTIQVAENEYSPPAPWVVAPRGLYWFDTEFWPTPPAPIIVDDVGPTLTTWQREPTVMLWLMDDSPAYEFREEAFAPPRAWTVAPKFLDPWFWATDDRPQTAVPLGVEPDPWPLPRPWPTTAHQALLGHPDEQPTFVAPQIVEPDPWPLPQPWPVPINAPLLGWQDELATVAALGLDASGIEPVLRVWPVPVPAQPSIGEDEKVVVPQLADIENELFPLVTPERVWHVPYPWEVEQHMLAFLSPHWPVSLRDYSGPRYIVDDASGTRYPITDDSHTRYEVEP